MDLRVIIPPTVEPVSVAQANFHLRLTVDADDVSPQPEDALVGTLITSARQAAENYLNRPIAEATFELRGGDFETEIPAAPVSSLVSVIYTSTAGAPVSASPALYRLAGPVDAPVLRLAYGASWPGDVRDEDDAVAIQFVAGYGAAYPLPAPIFQAILLMVGHLYENREDSTAANLKELPMGSRFLLNPYRLRMGV